MPDKSPRYIKIDDWYFEIKTVRALKVDKYGEPYKAIANCNINGNSMYVDGLLTKKEDGFTKQDFMTFYKFSQRLELDSFSYHRYHNGESVVKDVKIHNPHSDNSSKEIDTSEVADNFNYETSIRLVK